MSIIVAALKGVATGFGKMILTVLTSVASEKFTEWAFFWLAQKIVDSTKNTVDDEWLKKIRETYDEAKNAKSD